MEWRMNPTVHPDVRLAPSRHIEGVGRAGRCAGVLRQSEFLIFEKVPVRRQVQVQARERGGHRG